MFSAYCFQFFRADELPCPITACGTLGSAYCFQFFRADERNKWINYTYKQIRAYCFQFFRADELHTFGSPIKSIDFAQTVSTWASRLFALSFF